MARTNGFEGGANGSTVTNANSGGASGTALTSPVAGTGAAVVFDNTQSHLGSFSCRTSTGGTSALAYTNWTWTAKGEDYCRAHFRFVSLPSAQQGLLRYLSGGAQALRVNVKTDGTLEVRNAANTVITPGGTTVNAISAGSWFRVESHVTASTTVGAIELRLFLNPNSATPTETLTLTNLALTATVDEIRFGIGAAMTNAVQSWHDAIGADHTTWFGPALVPGTAALATTFAAPATGTRTVLGAAPRSTTFTAPAAGTRTVPGTAALAATFTAPAASTRTVLGTAPRSTTFTAPAASTRTVPGTAALAAVFAAAAAGVRTVTGQAGRTATFTAPMDSTAVTPTPVTPGVPTAALDAPALAATATGPTLTAAATAPVLTPSVSP